MKSEQGGGGRENGYPRTPEPEISKPLAGLPKPLAFGPPVMPGLSFPPNLGGLGKNVQKKTFNYPQCAGGFPGPRPPGFSFLPPGPNQGMPGMLLFQFSLYSGSDEYFVGPIRRRITDKAPMSLPSGRRDDQIYLESQKRDLSSYRACYHHDTSWEKKNRSRFFKVMLEA